MATSTLSQSDTAASTVTVPTTTLDARPHLPLTTIYTPPPSCSSIVTWDGTHLWQFGTNQTGGDCYPPKFRSIYNSYYSPGICPHDWTSAGSLQSSTGFDAMYVCIVEIFKIHKSFSLQFSLQERASSIDIGRRKSIANLLYIVGAALSESTDT